MSDKQTLSGKKRGKGSRRFVVNTKNAGGQLPLIQHIAGLNQDWKLELREGVGKLMWYCIAPYNEQELLLHQGKLINKIMGVNEISDKKGLGQALNLMARYFPDDYNFFPKTYTMPEDLDQLSHDMSKGRSYYITKPTSGAQGEGISLIKSFNELQAISKRIEDIVVQKYVHDPLTLYGKKFDLRIYVAICQLDPVVAYICQEGLARFCTEDYQPPTNANIGNGFIHLTNYSLNKRSANFIHTDELTAPNEGSKQTLTSLWNGLAVAGVDVATIQANIESVVAKTMLIFDACLCNEALHNYHQSRERRNRNFHIFGVDVMIDQNLDVWLLEINQNASLSIDQEEEVSIGITRKEVSPLDRYIKTFAVQDAVAIMRHKNFETLPQLGSYIQILPASHKAVDFGGILAPFNAMRTLF